MDRAGALLMHERLMRLRWDMACWSMLLFLMLLPLMSLLMLTHAQTVPQVLESGFDRQRQHERNSEHKPERDHKRNGEDKSVRKNELNGEDKADIGRDLSDLPYAASADFLALTAKLEIDRQSAFVNEQILLTLQVSAPAIAFNITGSQLRVANAELISLHKQESVEQINGKAFQTSRTVYALFAREPGVLQIPTLTFKAMLPVGAGGDTRGGTANTGLTSSTNPIIEDSTDAFQLSIETAPSTDKLWFPAKFVHLSSHWSVDTLATNAVRAGEPVARHVTIQVTGQHPAAIPDSVISTLEGVRIYPELPHLETQASPTGLGGTRVDSAVIIASRAGTITLPAIDVHWWDINQREWRTSSLPAEQLRVQPASTDLSTNLLITSRRYQKILISGTLVIAALLVTCLLLWRSKRRHLAMDSLTQGPAALAKPTSEHAAWASLRRDIRRKDLPGIRCSLQRWVKSLGLTPTVQPLDHLVSTWPALKPMLQALDAALYSQRDDETLVFNQLLRELKLLRAHVKSPPAPGNVATMLYPGRENPAHIESA